MKRQRTGCVRRAASAAMMAGVTAAGLCLSAAAQTAWNSASDGVWTNAEAWTAGVPDANAAFLTNNAASYVVTVDATPATPYGNLTLANAAGNTTRLNVNAPDFTSTSGLLTFGRGAEVVVNSGGVMCYTGRTTSVPFVTVRDGGVWRVDGGNVDFSNLKRGTPTSGNSQVYVGTDSTGRLEIVSGTFQIKGLLETYETNNTVNLRIGSGTGRGFLEMTGGTLRLWSRAGGTALTVGNGAGSIGSVSLSGDAVLSVVSNAAEIGASSGATGRMTIAENALFDVVRAGGRFNVAHTEGAYGEVTVRDNGVWNMTGSDGMFVGGNGNNGKGVVNVAGGRLYEGGSIYLCRSLTSTGGSGELNLSGGEVHLGINVGYGLFIGRAEHTTGRAYARLNVSGGLLDLSRTMWNGWDNRQGLIVGVVGAVAGGIAVGEVVFSGGTVTNSGQFILGTGLGATGIVVQTGGDVRQGIGRSGVTGYPMTIGWGGGRGHYTMSGGALVSAKNVYVGGLTTNDLGYIPNIVCTSNSIGVLRIDGGSFAVTNANLYLGRYGTGTLILGSNGVCRAKDIVLTDNTRSTVRFELGENGAGTLTAQGTLTVSAGAKLEVDTSAYKGDAAWVKLIDCATRSGTFAPENITVTGNGVIRQNRGDQDVWLYLERGTVIQLL